MCELLCLSCATKTTVEPEMREFFGHSIDNPDGWGLAWADGSMINEQVNITFVKEPVRAVDSALLQRTCDELPATTLLMGHIRKATSNVSYDNCHPWQLTDACKTIWTFMHNGYLRDESLTAGYATRQVGKTDSERIFLFLMDRLNAAYASMGEKNVAPCPQLRLGALAAAIDELCACGANKVNLLFTDGERIFVHTNTSDPTLHIRSRDGQILIATTPLEPTGWEPLPRNQLLVLERGAIVAQAPAHSGTFAGGEPISFEEAAAGLAG